MSETKRSIYNAIKKAFLNEERAKNDHILEYTIKPGKEKTDGSIDAWYLNFYVSTEIYTNMMKLIKTTNSPRNFSRYVISRKAPNGEVGREMEISLRLVHPEGMIDENGEIVQNPKVAPGQSVALILTLYKIYTTANGGEKPSESLRSIIEGVTRTVKHRITGFACSNAVKSAQELWSELSQKLGSDEVKSLINKLTISYTDDSIIDHKLSIGNKLRALGQARRVGLDITYLATDTNWRMMFNRTVNPNAIPIFLIVPWTNTVGKKETNTFAQSHGMPDPETMSAQQYFEAFIRANAINLPHGFGWAVYYDVSQTSVIAGEKDSYKDDIGYEDNLNGVPNEYTRTALGLQKAQGEEISKALYGNDMLDTNRALRATQFAAKALGTQVINPQGDNENAKLFAIKEMIANMAEYCVVKKGRVIKPENANPIIKYITIWVMFCMKMNPSGFGAMPNLDEKMNIIAYNFFQEIIFLIEKGVKETYKQDKLSATAAQQNGAIAEEDSMVSEEFKINIPSFEEFCNGIK